MSLLKSCVASKFMIHRNKIVCNLQLFYHCFKHKNSEALKWCPQSRHHPTRLRYNDSKSKNSSVVNALSSTLCTLFCFVLRVLEGLYFLHNWGSCQNNKLQRVTIVGINLMPSNSVNNEADDVDLLLDHLLQRAFWSSFICCSLICCILFCLTLPYPCAIWCFILLFI